MRWLKKLFNFYIESSIHVAFSVYALICITFLKLNIHYDEVVAYFGFFGTIVGYNFIKYDELVRIKKIKLSSLFKAILGISFVSFLACFYCYLQLKTVTKVYGFVTLLITILYTLPFIPKKTNMRNWAGLKIYLVALAWVVVTVWLPVLNAEVDFDTIVLLKSLQRFIFVFVLMLIFEIIDLKNDAKNLRTIPQQIGVKKTKMLTYFLLIVFVLMDFFKPNIASKDLLITVLVASIIGLVAYFSNEKKSKYYSSFWVEAIPIFWLVLLLLV